MNIIQQKLALEFAAAGIEARFEAGWEFKHSNFERLSEAAHERIDDGLAQLEQQRIRIAEMMEELATKTEDN